ncbi:MAG: GNAT family N-acetyltransferase [Clostridiales bacterium]|nr:GNAT family N-acetyltransferase [Clostridiales bacterium]
MNIHGEKVILRAMEPEDMDLLLKGINDPEVERLTVGWSYPVSKAQQSKWYEKVVADTSNHRWIVQIKDGEAIGMCSLYSIDWKNRVAHTGMKIIDTSHRGKGYGVDAEKALEKFAFEELQLNRLEGSILPYNEASKALYLKKCGWAIEGTKRQAIYKEDTYHDLLIVSLLKEDYLKLK